MHRNTFINAPHLLDASLQLKSDNANKLPIPLFVAGQFGGTEGYCEAIASGLWVALGVCAYLKGESLLPLPKETAFGALLAYATSEETIDYQPMHVNFGIMPPFEPKIRNKRNAMLPMPLEVNRLWIIIAIMNFRIRYFVKCGSVSGGIF